MGSATFGSHLPTGCGHGLRREGSRPRAGRSPAGGGRCGSCGRMRGCVVGRIGWLVACGSRAAGAVWSVALERGAQRETSLPGKGEGQHRPRLPSPRWRPCPGRVLCRRVQRGWGCRPGCVAGRGSEAGEWPWAHALAAPLMGRSASCGAGEDHARPQTRSLRPGARKEQTHRAQLARDSVSELRLWSEKRPGKAARLGARTRLKSH